MADGDIICRTIKRLRTLHPEVSETEWLRREVEWRIAEGGESHYVWKRAQMGKALFLAESLAAGTPINEARKVLGISRWTAARLLGRKWVSGY